MSGVPDFLRERKDAIICSWEARVTAEEHGVSLTGLVLRNDIPLLLDGLAAWLASDAAPEMSLLAGHALAHVLQRLDAGLPLGQVFREYRLLRETIIAKVLEAEEAEQERTGASGEEDRSVRIKALARLNAGLDVVLSQSIEQFVEERERRATLQRTSATQALRDSETRYRSLFESMDEGFCIIEVLFDGELPVDYRFLQVNPAFERHTGLKNVTGRLAREVVPDLDQHWFETYGRVAQTGEPTRLEDVSRALRRFYDVYAFRLGAPEQHQVAVLFNDITQRKRAEEELRETEARVHSVTNNLPDTVVYQVAARLDGARHFTYLSGGVAALFGCTAEQVIADASILYGKFLEEDRQLLADEEREALTHTVPFKTESRVRKASGEVAWVYAASAPRRRQDDGSIVWDGVIIDITERKRAEEQIKAANLQLAEADRRKNEFLAVLSHELRNPLAPIRNSVYILEHAAPGGEQAVRARQVIDRQAQHMARLIEDLLDVTRISRGKVVLQRESVDLNAIVKGTAEDHRETFARNGVDLQIVEVGKPLWIFGDRTRLAQVIGNLLTNATKFTPRGGKTVLTIDSNAGHAVVRVRDNGAGISAETQGNLFEPFVQGAQAIERTLGGLGLGLALVKGLVELHGGTVTAYSEGEGRGSEFVVTLPQQAQVTTVDGGGCRVPQHAEVRRVLVVEDNVDSAESLREALSLSGHEMTVAYSGSQGLEAARANRPDVIFCDIGLPGIDGYEVARAIRWDSDPKLRRTFLVALSGYALPEDVAKSREAGFDRHIAKPPSIEALEKILNEGTGRPDQGAP